MSRRFTVEFICDVDGKDKITVLPGDLHYPPKGWSQVMRDGASFDLCPKHSAEAATLLEIPKVS